MGKYDAVFQPIDVGGVTIPNRIVRSAHTMPRDEAGLTAYLVTRAEGGVGMQTIAATSVVPDAAGRPVPGNVGVYSDDCIPELSRVAKAVQAHGSKLFQQLFHMGAGQSAALEAPHHYSASEVPNFMAGVVPVAMSKEQIEETVVAFGSAARRLREAGLDGVDIHASSGYLLHEFLSPALNKRDDGYGGSEENRMRFLLEVIAEIRRQVGDGDFAVGVRLPNEDYVPGGLTADLVKGIAEKLDPLVDYISLHMAAYWRFHKLIALTDDPLGVEMPSNDIITPNLTKPTIVVGRISTIDQAQHIVSSGQADMVSMVRALIADPHLVNKARRGDEARIRPCLGTNQGCVGRMFQGRGLSCIVNISNAVEGSVTLEPENPTDDPKKILVIGGGPSGLEFARTAAMRGHQVILHEAAQKLGGQVNLAAAAPHRADVGAITAWLADELELLQVQVHINSFVDIDKVREIDPDEVVVATGSTPRFDGFQVSTPALPIGGFDLPHVHNSWGLFGYGDPFDIRGPAVVFDDTGSFEAISAADALLQEGVHVTMVSRFEEPGGNLPYPPVTVGAAKERLYNSDFDFIGGHYLREVREGEVDVGVLFTDRCRTLPANTVILVQVNEPNRSIGYEAQAAGYRVHEIGDAQGKDYLYNAIHTGAKLGRVI